MASPGAMLAARATYYQPGPGTTMNAHARGSSAFTGGINGMNGHNGHNGHSVHSGNSGQAAEAHSHPHPQPPPNGRGFLPEHAYRQSFPSVPAKYPSEGSSDNLTIGPRKESTISGFSNPPLRISRGSHQAKASLSASHTFYQPKPKGPCARCLSRCASHLPHFPVIDPQQSLWLDRWDFVVLIVLMEVTFAIPYELAFLEVQLNSTFFVNRIVDLVFLTDMCLRFFVAVPDPQKRGCWIKDHSRIAWAYLTGWFIPDILSLLPVDTYILFASKVKSQNLKVLRAARIVRLIKVTQGLRLLQRWRINLGMRNWLVSILGLLCSLSVTCHWCACLWAGIGLRMDPDLNWIDAVQRGKGGPDSLYEDKFQIYIMALYWAVYTMAGIGYGDITPQNTWEYKTALVCMSIMAGSFALVIAEVCAITSTFSEHEVNFKRTMDDLNWLLSEWKVHHPVRRRLRLYFMESRDLQRTIVQKTILEQMSPKLQGEVLNSIHRPWTTKVRFLKDISDEALVAVVQRLQASLFAPDEEIVGERTLFIVRRGVAVLLGKIKVSGTTWGEDMILHNPYIRKRDCARALCYLEVASLRYQDLMSVAEEHYDLYRKIQEAARCLGTHHSVVLVHRVVKQLRFNGVVADTLTKGQTARLVTASLCGAINGDVDANPLQKYAIVQMLREALEDEGAPVPDFLEDDGPDMLASVTMGRGFDEKEASLREATTQMLSAFGTKVESALANAKRLPSSRATMFDSRISVRGSRVSRFASSTSVAANSSLRMPFL